MNSPTVRQCPDLVYQGWLVGSTDASFRQQLVGFFTTHLPDVIRGCEEKESEALALVKTWLSQNDSWFFVVEDANLGTHALQRYIPPSTGRLLVTSQAPLHTTTSTASYDGPGSVGDVQSGSATGMQPRMVLAGDHVTAMHLQPPTTQQSILIWRKMNVFSAPAQSYDEAYYAAECSKTAGAVGYLPPKKTPEKSSDKKVCHA